ncbi:MAG TPA: ABC transporter substrate-binding protein [bacterium]|nr:ABC transporter substrate-binding protein [bacterium]
MNYAINKDVLVKVVLEGLGEPAYGPLPPSIWGYWPGIVDYAPHYDPAKAKQLFAEAGYAPGPDGTLQKAGRPLAFTLFTTPADTGVRTAQLVQANLRAFGVKMDIQTYEFGTILEKFKKGDQQAGFMGYTYNEPDIMFIWFDSANIGSGLNFSHYADPKLDALIDAARTRRTRPSARRCTSICRSTSSTRRCGSRCGPTITTSPCSRGSRMRGCIRTGTCSWETPI